MTAVRRDIGTETIIVIFSKEDVLSDMNRLFTNNEIGDVLGENSLDRLDLVFKIVAAFDDTPLGEQHRHP